MQINFQEALTNPHKAFARPSAVLEDLSLDIEQKRRILKRWEAEAIHLEDSEGEGLGGGEPSYLEEIELALKALD